MQKDTLTMYYILQYSGSSIFQAVKSKKAILTMCMNISFYKENFPNISIMFLFH